ncbi:MAG TPA: RNA polymerase sigma factor SigZ [Pyrinomonadaceae bacterium]|nr:RNA polymerase sigma factor SigZ [Pyrinomonadaceae bacterium]
MTDKNSEIVSRIWEESRKRIKTFINKRINNEADAEDVLQNVFCKIHQNIAELKDPEKLYPWIFQTTRNAIIDFYRERKIQTDSADEILNEIAVEQTEKDIEEEVLRWLEPMIGELPEKYRDALLLTDIQGFTQKDLSEKLNISLSGAKSRVQRGREHLKATLLNCCQLEFNRAGQIVEYRQKTAVCRVCSH